MKKLLTLLIAFSVVRFLLSFSFDLTPQESYYFLYSQHPALSYFDHPPAIAWLLGASSALFGKHVFALRLASLLTTMGTQLALIFLARRFLPRSRWTWTILISSTTLLISTLSLISTPDVPLLLFWTLSLLYLYRALFENRHFSWIWAGLFMGLAFDSKYTAVFLPLGLFIFLILSTKHRYLLKTKWPYVSILTANLVMLPVYIWNYQNGFASFLFQSSGRTSSFTNLTHTYVIKLLITQSFLLLPPLLFFIVFAAFKSLRLTRRLNLPVRSKPLFLICFTIPMMAIFGTISLFALVKPNWLMPCYLTGIILAARIAMPRGLIWAHFGFSGIMHLAAAIQFIFYPIPIKSDDTWFGWRELATQVDHLRAQYPKAFVFADDGYKTSAELRFYSSNPVYAGNILGSKALQFDYLQEDLRSLKGKDAIFLDSQPTNFSPEKSGHIPSFLPRFFGSTKELDPIIIRNGDAIVRKFLVYHCTDYRLQ